MTPHPGRPGRTRGLTLIDGALSLMVVLLIVQVWLLTATLEAYLAGRVDSALPGAVVSGLLFAACGGLYAVVRRVDAAARRPVDPPVTGLAGPSGEPPRRSTLP